MEMKKERKKKKMRTRMFSLGSPHGQFQNEKSFRVAAYVELNSIFEGIFNLELR